MPLHIMGESQEVVLGGPSFIQIGLVGQLDLLPNP